MDDLIPCDKYCKPLFAQLAGESTLLRFTPYLQYKVGLNLNTKPHMLVR